VAAPLTHFVSVWNLCDSWAPPFHGLSYCLTHNKPQAATRCVVQTLNLRWLMLYLLIKCTLASRAAKEENKLQLLSLWNHRQCISDRLQRIRGSFEHALSDRLCCLDPQFIMMALLVQRLATGCKAEVRFPARERDCSIPAHPAFYSRGTMGCFACWTSCRNVKLTAHLHPVPKSWMVEIYLHSPIRLHGVMFN
jgi:hypothetical protein